MQRLPLREYASCLIRWFCAGIDQLLDILFHGLGQFIDCVTAPFASIDGDGGSDALGRSGRESVKQSVAVAVK